MKAKKTQVVSCWMFVIAFLLLNRPNMTLSCRGKQSNAKINLLREEVRGQRPCIIEGIFYNVMQAATRHWFSQTDGM